MTETLHQNTIDQIPPKGWKMGMPGNEGFYALDRTADIEDTEYQRIVSIPDEYRNTVQVANEEDIANLDTEFTAWNIATEIANQVKNNPNTQLTAEQLQILSAIEANNDAIKATFLFTESQRQMLFTIDSNAVGEIIHGMVQELRTRWSSATDAQERLALEREMSGLRDYLSMLDNDEATFDIASIDNAVQAYKNDNESADYISESEKDAKANVYFAKYAKAIINAGLSKQHKSAQEVLKAEQENAKNEALNEARNIVEKNYDREFFEKIVTLTKNKTLLNTDVIGGLRDVGDGPKNEAKLLYLPEDFRQYYARNNQSKDWRHELNEVIMFSDVVEQEKREVKTKQQTKGRFGRVHTTEYTKIEVIHDSERSKMIKNEVTGKDEPAVRFRYQFKYGNLANSSNELPKYREFNGNRGGQQIIASVELPKSTADQLQKLVLDDPQNARIFVEQLFLSNNDGAVKDEYWYEGGDLKTPIRPPYEQLPEDWTVTIATTKEVVEQGRPQTLEYDINRVKL